MFSLKALASKHSVSSSTIVGLLEVKAKLLFAVGSWERVEEVC